MNVDLVNLAFNLPIDSLFTYSVPKELTGEVKIGCRVLAPLGSRNITGIVIDCPTSTTLRKVKPICKLLDAEPIINNEMLEFCRWISKYYFSPIGEVVFSAIPKSIIMESKIIFRAKTEPQNCDMELTEHQEEIFNLLLKKPLTIKQIEGKLKYTGARSVIHSLITKNLVESEYIEASAKVKAKIEKFVTFELLEDFIGFTSEMIDIFAKDTNMRSQKQVDLLKYFIVNKIKVIELTKLLKDAAASTAVVNSLCKKDILKIDVREVQRKHEQEFSNDEKIIELNSDQKDVIKKIIGAVNKKEFNPYLLYGVTGSGKTQVYIESIKYLMTQNKTAIVLVPEISLTPQLIHRFRTNFGDIIGVIHSRLTEGQKFDVFRRIISGDIKIIIGARSALFAPIKNIGMIVVDEEHDSSYKQAEKSPRYHARDSAIIRGKINNAVVVMGSATPSLESYYNARTGKYNILELPHRAMKTKLPAVEIIDMKQELKPSSKYVKYESPEKRFLSPKLIYLIDQTIKNKQSIILLQNRRGYSAYLECQECGNVEMCRNCDITLIYHKAKNHLRCHYCGFTIPLPEKCSKCGSSNILLKGTGTEKVEEEIMRLFPHARIKRMDADTVRKKDSYRQILKSFHEREFDMLVGTQMISKGLDFPNVYLVGVVSADIGLLTPDFRSYERTFQLMMQVSGRSGRSSDNGRVIIQTMHPENYIFPYIIEHDYEGFYQKEISFRRNFRYPPFSRLCLIEVEGNDAGRANSIASRLYMKLKNLNDEKTIEIMKPTPALIYKLKNRYRFHIIVKSLKQGNEQIVRTESLLKSIKSDIENINLRTTERIHIDVDPINFV